jgi:hypothetical protein
MGGKRNCRVAFIWYWDVQRYMVCLFCVFVTSTSDMSISGHSLATRRLTPPSPKRLIQSALSNVLPLLQWEPSALPISR